jgi:hypothetical protein
MVVFALSHIFIKFIKIKSSIQLPFISILLIISTLIHRTAANSIFSIFQNTLYFSPVYLLGMYVSINFNTFYEMLKGQEFYFLATAIIIAFIQSGVEIIEKYRELSTLILEKFDLMIIQKILLSIFFVLFLSRFENKKIKLIDLFAENSFGIFFIHGICIWIFNAILFKFKISLFSNSTSLFFGLSTFILIISLAITMLIRKVFPRNSKYIIGC